MPSKRAAVLSKSVFAGVKPATIASLPDFLQFASRESPVTKFPARVPSDLLASTSSHASGRVAGRGLGRGQVEIQRTLEAQFLTS